MMHLTQISRKLVMTIEKEATYHDMPIEKEFGYAQAIKVGDTIYLSGQVSWNPDDQNNIVGIGNMEVQMRQVYTNIGICVDLIFRIPELGRSSRSNSLNSDIRSTLSSLIRRIGRLGRRISV